MKQPYLVAVIHKDAVEHLPVVVMPHEVRVLAAVHGEHKVTIDENADLPGGLTEGEFEPEDEYARLEQHYGQHRENGMSFVSIAFGGRDGFMRAMEALSDDEPKPARRRRQAETAEA